jgi:ElaB/YqjD/DUF883 family membrane-anchored ribosome-binding protein
MASTSGNVPYPTSSSTEGDSTSGLSSGTGSSGSGLGSTAGSGSPSMGSDLGTVGGSGTASSNGSVQPVVDRVAESAHRVVDQLAGKAGPAVERLRSTVTGAKDSMGQRMSDLTHTREEWMESARESVRQNPLAAVGLAAAVGYLLARLTSHDR